MKYSILFDGGVAYTDDACSMRDIRAALLTAGATVHTLSIATDPEHSLYRIIDAETLAWDCLKEMEGFEDIFCDVCGHDYPADEPCPSH